MSKPIRCRYKKDCAVAWPEDCPYWNRWACPVDADKGQAPRPAEHPEQTA